jgi:hypothetical protein
VGENNEGTYHYTPTVESQYQPSENHSDRTIIHDPTKQDETWTYGAYDANQSGDNLHSNPYNHPTPENKKKVSNLRKSSRSSQVKSFQNNWNFPNIEENTRDQSGTLEGCEFESGRKYSEKPHTVDGSSYSVKDRRSLARSPLIQAQSAEDSWENTATNNPSSTPNTFAEQEKRENTAQSSNDKPNENQWGENANYGQDAWGEKNINNDTVSWEGNDCSQGTQWGQEASHSRENNTASTNEWTASQKDGWAQPATQDYGISSPLENDAMHKQASRDAPEENETFDKPWDSLSSGKNHHKPRAPTNTDSLPPLDSLKNTRSSSLNLTLPKTRQSSLYNYFHKTESAPGTTPKSSIKTNSNNSGWPPTSNQHLRHYSLPAPNLVNELFTKQKDNFSKMNSNFKAEAQYFQNELHKQSPSGTARNTGLNLKPRPVQTYVNQYRSSELQSGSPAYPEQAQNQKQRRVLSNTAQPPCQTSNSSSYQNQPSSCCPSNVSRRSSNSRNQDSMKDNTFNSDQSNWEKSYDNSNLNKNRTGSRKYYLQNEKSFGGEKQLSNLTTDSWNGNSNWRATSYESNPSPNPHPVVNSNSNSGDRGNHKNRDVCVA